MIQVPYCEKCKIPMSLREKNGDKYFGCSNWKNCHTKTKPYYGVDKEPQPAPQPTTNGGTNGNVPSQSFKPPLPAEYGGEVVNPQLLIMNALQDIYTVLKEIRDNLKK